MLRAKVVAMFGLVLVLAPRIAAAEPSPDPRSTTLLELGKVAERVQIYILRKGVPPPSLEVVYLPEATPTDGWGHALHLVVPGTEGRPYDLVSYGADGLPGGDDLVHTWPVLR